MTSAATHPAGRRRVSLPVIGLCLIPVLVLAALADTEVAETAAHAPLSLIQAGVDVSRLGLSGYMLGVSAALAVVAVVVRRRTGHPALALRAAAVAARALLFFATVALSGIVCQAIKHVFGRARPKLMGGLGAFHLDPLTWHAGRDSFPSGHATTAFAAAVVLSALMPAWRLAFFALAVLICIARILAGAHYLSDVIAGAVLGCVVADKMIRLFVAHHLPPHERDGPEHENRRASDVQKLSVLP